MLRSEEAEMVWDEKRFGGLREDEGLWRLLPYFEGLRTGMVGYSKWWCYVGVVMVGEVALHAAAVVVVIQRNISLESLVVVTQAADRRSVVALM